MTDSSAAARTRLLRRLVLAGPLAALLLATLSALGTPVQSASARGWLPPRTGGESVQPSQPDKISASEFARLVREFSEEGGYFRSDNFTSNETSYLHVVSKLRQLGASGGAYIGVGPEQNFTYIAKVRPRIAFIVDIRRQAMIQHLMFKAVFHLASDRAQYLSLLLSRPPPKENRKENGKETEKEREKVPAPGASIGDILAYIGRLEPDDKAYEANLAAIRKTIREEFQVQLGDADQASLDYIYRSFRAEGLGIAYRMEGMTSLGWFPTMQELILQPDQFGKLGNFLAAKDDYDFVRDMQRRNMIIPVVGDFAGRKALASIGDYLRKTGFTVTAFYTSNVEQYLFQGGVFPIFVDNVRKLPISGRSLFIRGVPNIRFSHPARVSGHMITTLLQHMSVFLKDVDEGAYQSYTDLVTTHYIAGEGPPQ